MSENYVTTINSFGYPCECKPKVNSPAKLDNQLDIDSHVHIVVDWDDKCIFAECYACGKRTELGYKYRRFEIW